ncbi:hypothetical protein AB0B97_20740 [Micromonospora sp. NPDC049004]|uniref:hypothetical protein n=1 Tax=unclassified Micromonospora TaxID=2617518 RepID=UPI001F464034|nr:hypothetical protein [Micromonospora sp. MH99]
MIDNRLPEQLRSVVGVAILDGPPQPPHRPVEQVRHLVRFHGQDGARRSGHAASDF